MREAPDGSHRPGLRVGCVWISLYSAHLDRDLVDEERLGGRAVAGVARRLQCLERLQPFLDLTEHGIAAVEARGGPEQDEELAAVRARARVRRGHDARGVVQRLRARLARELVPGATTAVAERVTALRHEALHHAVELEP